MSETDFLEGCSWVPKNLVDARPEIRFEEDAAFEREMEERWREKNGDAQYVLEVEDHGLLPARTWRAADGSVTDVKEGYETVFRFRRK